MPLDPSKIEPSLLYTFAEAAALSGVAVATIQSWRQRRLFEPAGGKRGARARLYIRGADLLRIVVGNDGKQDARPVESPARRRRAADAAKEQLVADGFYDD